MSQLPEPSEFREPPEVMSPMEVLRDFGLLSVEAERPRRTICFECDKPCDPGFRLCTFHYVQSKS